MPINLPQFSPGTWAVIAVAVIAILIVVLKVIRRVVSTSVRIAIVVGTVMVIAAALCALSAFLGQGELPIP